MSSPKLKRMKKRNKNNSSTQLVNGWDHVEYVKYLDEKWCLECLSYLDLNNNETTYHNGGIDACEFIAEQWLWENIGVLLVDEQTRLELIYHYGLVDDGGEKEAAGEL
jgi:hypothetical protein